MPYAAERTWFAIAPDGAEHTVTLIVGIPEIQPAGEWGVQVTMNPFDYRQRLLFGVDSWQATSLAMEFIATRLQQFADDGWRFYWEPNGDPASPEDLRARQAT